MKSAIVALGLAAAIGGAIVLLPRKTESTRHAEEARRLESASLAKVHFMREFVAALAAPPKNLMPQPDYVPLMKQGAAPIGCVDCHKDMDVEAKLATDPGDEAVQRFRMRREDFMVPLMEKWVARLNNRHADRLRKEVICTDCHAIDPRDEAYGATLAPLMRSFVNALTAPPRNQDPARGWKPLLKAPDAPSNLCAVCHGDGREAPPAPPPGAREPDRTFMIRLMERWVRELNRRMKDRLVKAVGCTDCHEIDPRK